MRCGGVDAPPWTLGVLNVAVDLRLRGVNLAIGDAVAWVGADAQCGADNSLYSTLLEDLGEGLHRGVSADRRRANVTVVPRSSGALELCYGLRGVSRVDAARYPRLRLLSRTVTGPAAAAAHAGVPFAVRWEGDGIGVAGDDVRQERRRRRRGCLRRRRARSATRAICRPTLLLRWSTASQTSTARRRARTDCATASEALLPS